MSLDSLALLAIVGGFFAFMAVELIVPAKRAMPQVRFWRLIGIAGFALTLAVNVFAPLLILPWFAGISALDLSGWGTWGRAAHGRPHPLAVERGHGSCPQAWCS